MKQTRLIMGMPVTVEVVTDGVPEEVFTEVFAYFDYVDRKFSTYKPDSEISRINRGELKRDQFSKDMVEVFALSEQTKRETGGYFDIQQPSGGFDPSGLVKGWAIHNVAEILRKLGYRNFYVEAGGDIETAGTNTQGQPWRVGIKNPFVDQEIIKVLEIHDKGVATSGTYIRGSHIYNPKIPTQTDFGVISLTVIGPNAYEADRFATAAFAMGKPGINFIDRLQGLEGYIIDNKGTATLTTNFDSYTKKV